MRVRLVRRAKGASPHVRGGSHQHPATARRVAGRGAHSGGTILPQTRMTNPHTLSNHQHQNHMIKIHSRNFRLRRIIAGWLLFNAALTLQVAVAEDLPGAKYMNTSL